MKIWISLILLIGFSLQLSAQEYFYYYKGTKIALELNPEYLFISAPNQNMVDNVHINVAIDPNHTLSQRDNTSQTLLKPQNFEEKNPVRFWKEIKLTKRHSKSAYLTQIQATRTANKDLIVAPYFKTKDGDKIGLSNFFYVKLKQETDFSSLLTQIKLHNLELVGNNQFMPLWYTVSVTPNSLDALQMANLFYETGLFQYVEPDLMIDVLLQDAQNTSGVQLFPDDTYYEDQWGLNNTGQHGGFLGIDLTDFDINVEAAWDITLGDNVTIAVLDEGFEMDHPDLVDNTIGTGYDSETGANSSVVYGPHGTACAGIAGARGNNNEGISGVAPNAGLISISNSLHLITSAHQSLANGLNWAWQNGADVISNSWGHSFFLNSSLIDDAITNALTNGREGLGSVVVFAAGNNNGEVIYPANSNPDILAVGAMSPCGERKSQGPTSCDGEYWWGSCFGNTLDIVAPGVLIPTTDRQGNLIGPSCWVIPDYNPDPCAIIANTYTNHNYFSRFNGTSSACPHIAGVAALVLSVNPNLTVQEVNDIIEQSAQKVRTDLYNYSTTTGRPNGTWHNEMGYGLVDAYQAVLLAQECPTSLNITQTYNNGDFADLEANNEIISNSTIQSGANVTFDAGNKITLLPDFHAQAGCNFLAVIDGCEGVYKTEEKTPPIVLQELNPALVDKSTISNLKSYPNPFSESTILSYTLSEDQSINLSIFNANGQEIARLLENTRQIAGTHEVTFDGQDLPNGLYFYRFMDSDGNITTGKMSKF